LSEVIAFLFSFPILNSFSAQENCPINSVAYQCTTWAARKLSASCLRFFCYCISGRTRGISHKESFIWQILPFSCWSRNCPSNFEALGS